MREAAAITERTFVYRMVAIESPGLGSGSCVHEPYPNSAATPVTVATVPEAPEGAVVKSQGRQPLVDRGAPSPPLPSQEPRRGDRGDSRPCGALPRGEGEAPERSQGLTSLALDHRPHSGAQIL